MARSNVLLYEAGAKRRASCTLAALAALAALLFAASAVAVDSTASLDARGLKLTFNPDISMECEDPRKRQIDPSITAGTDRLN